MVTPVMGPFTVTDTVDYVSESSPDVVSNARTFYKRITVTVTHANMSYPLKLTDVAIYRKYF